MWKLADGFQLGNGEELSGFSIRLERMKKKNNIYTYKEIVAFTEGRHLDETEQQQENGKRPYQRGFLWLGSAVLGAIIGVLMSYFFWR